MGFNLRSDKMYQVTDNALYVSIVIGGFVILVLVTLFVFGAMMIVRKAAAWSYSIFGLGITAAGYFIAGPIPLFEFRAYLWSIGVSAGMLAVGFGLTLSTLYSGMLDAANKVGRPDSMRLNAHVAGVFIGCLFLGVFLASLIADYVLPHFGWRWTTTFIAFLNIAVVLIGAAYKGWKVYCRRKRHFDDEYLAAAIVPQLVSYGSVGTSRQGSFTEPKQII